METLEKDDIQTLVFSGFPGHGSGAYVLLGVTDAARARAWLGGLSGALAAGERGRDAETAVNVALTAAGLAALGLPDDALATFPQELRAGMAGEDHRSRILGDTGESAPPRWQWGGPGSPPVHVLLMLYARDDAALGRCLGARRAEYAGACAELYVRDTVALADRREHFGFADGIAQPLIAGSDAAARPGRAGQPTVKAGEFVLGYANGYDKLPLSPTVAAALDPRSHLPPAAAAAAAAGGGARRDLGRNGTYLVVRQLEQDVAGFWQAMEDASREPADAAPDRQQAIRLAAKCVGRWPSGAPLVTSPERDDPAHARDDDFMYRTADPRGLACPVGAHIRRTNPRDSLEPGAAESLKVVDRHRILRRGRAYGPPLPPFAREEPRRERGLVFICLNVNIRRQFEFIQQTWSNNPKFGGLADDRDPLIGDQPPGGGTFTIPEIPVRRRLAGLERFVRVRGGAYFFLPGLRALRFLAALPAGR